MSKIVNLVHKCLEFRKHLYSHNKGGNKFSRPHLVQKKTVLPK